MLSVKNLPANARDAGSVPGLGMIPWRRKILWRWKWPTPVFLPGKSHEQRSLMGYSPWSLKRDMTEPLTNSSFSVIDLRSKKKKKLEKYSKRNAPGI